MRGIMSRASSLTSTCEKMSKKSTVTWLVLLTHKMSNLCLMQLQTLSSKKTSRTVDSSNLSHSHEYVQAVLKSAWFQAENYNTTHCEEWIHSLSKLSMHECCRARHILDALGVQSLGWRHSTKGQALALHAANWGLVPEHRAKSKHQTSKPKPKINRSAK